jgi:DNA polymerase zeta
MHRIWAKIMNGRYNVNDFVISKEVKLGKYQNPNALPAHAVVAMKLMEKDPMRAPKYGERLGYLVVQGINSKSRVKDLVVSLEEFLATGRYQINVLYYIKKQINAALGRLFATLDVDINVLIGSS